MKRLISSIFYPTLQSPLQWLGLQDDKPLFARRPTERSRQFQASPNPVEGRTEFPESVPLHQLASRLFWAVAEHGSWQKHNTLLSGWSRYTSVHRLFHPETNPYSAKTGYWLTPTEQQIQ